MSIKSHSEDDLPPGAKAVRSLANRGTGWYCQNCVAFIQPIWIRKDKAVYPACEDCFHDELPLGRRDRNVAVIKEVVVAAGTDQPA